MNFVAQTHVDRSIVNAAPFIETNIKGTQVLPEKPISVAICRALRNKKVSVYAQGLNTREWLYVDDCARGILVIMQKGRLGEVYNLGSSQEKKNIEVVRAILGILNKRQSLVQFVKDRPGHDWRYALDSSEVRKLGWKPKVSFSSGIKKTVAWNVANYSWLKNKLSK